MGSCDTTIVDFFGQVSWNNRTSWNRQCKNPEPSKIRCPADGNARPGPNVAPYRLDDAFLRNGFDGTGYWGIPIVLRQEIDLKGDVDLIASADTRPNDQHNNHKGVHHFVDDPRFASICKHPRRYVEKYSNYRFVITPDTSLFCEMPPWRQLQSIGESRWVGACWQQEGLDVIPSVSWALSPSFDFCFLGIERGSIVAVSTVGCRMARQNFMRGYDAMLERIAPPAVICFGEPFESMRGNVIVVDYRKSRKTVR